MALHGEPLVMLLVEDNLDHAELVLRSLTEHRLANTLRHVTDGEAALDYLFHRGAYADPRSSPKPNLVLLDLRLPKLDGLEVLKAMKAHGELRGIPVVVLTSSDAERDLARAYDSCVNSYLVKPVDWLKFAKVVEDLGFYWLVWNRVPGER
jgi:CheY-like chemotaxis protein